MAIIPYGGNDFNDVSTNTYKVTVGTSWTKVNTYYQQTVTVNGILATDNPIIDLIPTLTGFEDEQKAWGKVFKIVTGNNSITLYATEATETAVSIQLKVVR